jgi:hypothetical protein
MRPTKGTRTLIIVTAVVVLLGAPVVALAQPAPPTRSADMAWTVSFERLSQWMAEILDGLVEAPVATWQRTGCSADPSGANCPSETGPGAVKLDVRPACDPSAGEDCRLVPPI